MNKKRWHTSTEWKKGHHPSKKTEFKKGNIPWTKVHGHSKETKQKMTGNNSKLWKGILPLKLQIRALHESKEWRSNVFKRDNWTCQTCRNRGNILEAHHIKPFAKIIRDSNIKTIEAAIACQELWAIENGVTLCEDCHDLTRSNSKGG